MNLKLKDGVTKITLHASEQRTVKAMRELLALLHKHGEPQLQKIVFNLDVGLRGIQDAFCDPKLFDDEKKSDGVPATKTD